MLRYVTTLFLLLIITSANAQVSFEWSRTHTGQSQVLGKAVATDLFGNVVSVGTFVDTVQISSGFQQLISNGLQDTYILKSDPFGNVLWLRSFGGNLAEDVFDVNCDLDGNIVLTGHCRGNNIDFDPGPGVDLKSCSGLTDGFIMKLDAAGNYMWSQLFGGSNFERSVSLDVDIFRNIYVSGYFNGTVDFDPGAGTDIRTSNGMQDIFVLKYDKNGNYKWVNTYGGELNDVGTEVTSDNWGNVYLGGYFSDTIDFDPGPGTLDLIAFADQDLFIQKMDSSGNMLYTYDFGDTLGDAVRATCTDPQGNVYVSGVFSDTVDFNPGPGVNELISNGEIDMFVAKFDVNGQFVWAKSFGGAYNDRSRSIDFGADSYLYIAGEYTDTVIFDNTISNSTLISDTNATIYLLKLSQDGEFQWVRSIGYEGKEYVYGVAVDGSGNIYMTGNYKDSIDFDFESGLDFHSATNEDDAYLIKLNQCGDATIATASGMTFTAVTPYGASFQWLDCDNNYAPIQGANSSVFTATIPGSYALMTTMYGCTDTSACYYVTDAGMEIVGSKVLKMYPNPTTDHLKLICSENIEPNLIQIYDVQGSLLYTREVQSREIDLSFDLSNGVYFIQLISTNNEVFSNRFIVNR